MQGQPVPSNAMGTVTVQFLPSSQTVEARTGDNLLDIALEAGVHLNASCGGAGACGKCRVIIREGEADFGDCTKVPAEDYARGVRLACRTTIRSDLTVEVPAASRIDITGASAAKPRLHEARRISQQFSSQVIAAADDPPAHKIFLTLPPPTLDDNAGDMTRISRMLRTEHGIERTTVALPVLRTVPRLLREADFRITVALLQDGETEITNVEQGDTTGSQYAIAFDVGTTSLWGRLLDLGTKKTLAEASAYNPQIPCGDDVITRIVFAQKQGGLEKLRQAVAAGLDTLATEMLQTVGCRADDVLYVTAAGNTVMTHLFLGVDPKYIRETPYVPAARTMPRCGAMELGLQAAPHASVRCFPCPASYVGGDIVAGVLASGMHTNTGLTLYIDIGTNGEIVLGSADWLMAAACSAGPAFEGGGLRCGMRATAGAIEGFTIDDTTLDPMVVTVGRAPARGLCGSGAINVLAEFMRTGIIDQAGKFDERRDPQRIRRTDDGCAYVLVPARDAGAPEDIVITEADIGNLIRAKAAMFAGCHSLLEKAGLSFADIAQVIIAGSFGDYIDLEKAIAIGLLPDIPRERYTFIGNGSLLGAQLGCLSRAMLNEADMIAAKITTIELSEDRSFMDKYMAGLFLPHTDMHLFPSVKEWM